MSHDAFVAADAARKGGLRGQITADARTLRLNYERVLPQEGKPMLGFDGVARFAAAKGGVDGTLEVLANDVELLADGAGRTAGYTGASLSASALNRFNPVRMMVGGRLDLKPGDNYATFVSSTNNVTVRGGRAQRRRGVPDQRRHLGRHHGGRGRRHLDHRPWQAGLRFQHGLAYAAGRTGVLGLSNGTINLLPATPEMAQGPGYINIGLRRRCTGAATTLAAEGTLLVATDRAFTLADNARYGARNLLLAMSTLNLGDDAALAGRRRRRLAERADAEPARARQAAQGQCRPRHSRRRNPDPERARFGQCVWLGDAGRHAGQGRGPAGAGAPAIYGYGGAADTATIRSRELVWTGVSARPSDLSGQYDPAIPGAAIADRLGDGRLRLAAERIVFGYGPDTQPVNWLSAQRLALGFAGVDLLAGERVTANGQGTLKAYHRQGAYQAGRVCLQRRRPEHRDAAADGRGQCVHGLHGGRQPDAASAAGRGGAARQAGALGAQLTLAGGSVDLDGAIALASGKLKIEAERDLRLGAQSRLDLAGREVVFYDQTRYTWGGDLTLDSASGNIDQEVGSVIDLSARKQRGGTLAATALAPAPVGSTCAVPFWAARPACTTQAARACRMTPPRSRCGHGRWPTSPD